jgi:phosphoribosylaminoimidazolecarboxamide formyltransferase/IMP cyclohydrolase
MGINIVSRIDRSVPLRHALVSVSDKSGLERLIPGLLAVNPALRIYSTGGTFARIREILGPRAGGVLTQVSDYTGQPETQGGLVKTLDFKIYLGLLTETYNPAHQDDLQRTGAVPIDMVVVNLYPFEKTIAAAATTVEQARGNIDIGGPCMIRAAAKNFIRVASVVDPADYPMLLDALKANGGATPLELRLDLAKKAFAHTARYDQAIAAYLESRTLQEVDACYPANDQ